MDKILFKWDDELISKRTISSSLSELGLNRGDTVFVHSDMGTFGKLGDIKNGEDLCNTIIDIFLETIFPGTMIVPTFSYDFCKNQEYNPKSSKSDVGSLTNVFLKREGAIRSNHPIFSVAAIGDEAAYYAKIEKNVSFGRYSFFEKLLKHNVKIIGFGIDVIKSLTFLHHIEKMNCVPYRYIKTFKGKIRLDNEVIGAEYDYFVRELELNPTLRFERIRNHLIKNNALKTLKIGNSKIEIIRAKQTFELISKELNRDPYWLVEIKNNGRSEIK